MGHRQALLRAALLQIVAILLLVTLLWLLRGWSLAIEARLALVLTVVAGCCWRLNTLFALPPWWRWINAGFLPALAVALWLQLPAWVYAAGLLLSFLLFGATFRSRVPLWLSGRRARAALVELIPPDRDGALLDLGGGFAGVLLAVARARPRLRLLGYEWAFLPWLLGWLRLRLAGVAADWRCADFWALDLAAFDCVFAYLSPAPMPALWRKARAEMRAGSLLVSYRFPVPELAPTRCIEVGPDPRDRLWVYRLPGAPS